MLYQGESIYLACLSGKLSHKMSWEVSWVVPWVVANVSAGTSRYWLVLPLPGTRGTVRQYREVPNLKLSVSTSNSFPVLRSSNVKLFLSCTVYKCQ